jgi:hypothetical protein
VVFWKLETFPSWGVFRRPDTTLIFKWTDDICTRPGSDLVGENERWVRISFKSKICFQNLLNSTIWIDSVEVDMRTVPWQKWVNNTIAAAVLSRPKSCVISRWVQEVV